MNRRKFVSTSSLSSLGVLSAAYLPKIKQEEKIKVGMIGCGWYGIKLARTVMGIEGFTLASLCDIDTQHLKRVAGEIEEKQGSRPKEYGNGHLVDWGIHYIDYLRMVMDFESPTSVQSTGDIVVHKGKITTPDTLDVRMDFGACPIVWKHRMWGAGDLHPEFNSGYTFYGEEATMYGDFQRLIIQAKGKDKQQEIIDIPTKGVLAKDLINFLEAVRSRDKSSLLCPIEEGFQSTATVQLAMISYYTGSKITWDQENKTITNNSEASKLLARPYRGVYKRPKT